jgi:hypothetical protein
MIGQVRGLLVMARLSCRLAMLPPYLTGVLSARRMGFPARPSKRAV